MKILSLKNSIPLKTHLGAGKFSHFKKMVLGKVFCLQSFIREWAKSPGAPWSGLHRLHALKHLNEDTAVTEWSKIFTTFSDTEKGQAAVLSSVGMWLLRRSCKSCLEKASSNSLLLPYGKKEHEVESLQSPLRWMLQLGGVGWVESVKKWFVVTVFS